MQLSKINSFRRTKTNPQAHPAWTLVFVLQCGVNSRSLPPVSARPGMPAVALRRLVGVPGIEPGTSSLSGMRSNRLSYTPDWWRQTGSNRRHPACKAGALPTELCPRLAPLNYFRTVYDPHLGAEMVRLTLLAHIESRIQVSMSLSCETASSFNLPPKCQKD
jgi:hypothetical protein